MKRGYRSRTLVCCLLFLLICTMIAPVACYAQTADIGQSHTSSDGTETGEGSIEIADEEVPLSRYPGESDDRVPLLTATLAVAALVAGLVVFMANEIHLHRNKL